MKTNDKATFEELVAILSQGIGQRTLYFAEHPRVQGYANEFVAMPFGGGGRCTRAR